MLRYVAFILLLAVTPAWAWNSGTHRLIAWIAWQELTPPARSALSQLLVRHPDYNLWAQNSEELQPALRAFIGAATWPDDIRQDPRFYEDFSSSPTDSIPGLEETARHRHWHYAEQQLDGSPREGNGELDKQLPRLIKLLGNHSSSSVQKTYALPWVIHLVGEMHQPFHIANNHDRGGNLLEVEDPANTRQPVKTLHRWWDDLPAPVWLHGRALERSAKQLLQNYSFIAPPQGTPELWQQESFSIARNYGYPPTRHIGSEFRDCAKALAEHRTVEAGIRLGNLLQAIFGGVSRETASE